MYEYKLSADGGKIVYIVVICLCRLNIGII